MNSAGSRVRITAGCLRGRYFPVPDIAGVRPTPSKVRQALFNMLGNVEGISVLDLFSGSGLMAMEAISRGASHVISIESNRHVIQHLQGVRKQWEMENHWQLLHGDAHTILEQLADQRFGLVFADPPYEQGISECIPHWLDESGISCDWLVIEESARIEPRWSSGWTQQKPRRYGDTCLHFLEPEVI